MSSEQDENLETSLLQLRKSCNSNLGLCLTFAVISILLAVSLITLILKGYPLLEEQMAFSPQFRIHDIRTELIEMRKSAEAQYNEMHEEDRVDPLIAIEKTLIKNTNQLNIEEGDWSLAINFYDRIIKRFSAQMGDIREWHYFYQKKLTTLINNSADRKASISSSGDKQQTTQ